MSVCRLVCCLVLLKCSVCVWFDVCLMKVIV